MQQTVTSQQGQNARQRHSLLQRAKRRARQQRRRLGTSSLALRQVHRGAVPRAHAAGAEACIVACTCREVYARREPKQGTVCTTPHFEVTGGAVKRRKVMRTYYDDDGDEVGHPPDSPSTGAQFVHTQDPAAIIWCFGESNESCTTALDP